MKTTQKTGGGWYKRAQECDYAPSGAVTVERYSDRTWAVYVNGDLLCVTMYKKGAYAVKALLERLWREYVIMKEKLEAAAGDGWD